MSWEPGRQPQAFYDNVLHPGMYAADFEQHAFYEQQSQLEARGNVHSNLVFDNYNYQDVGASGMSYAYNPMHMPVFPPNVQQSPGMPVYSNTEAGANGFSHETESFHYPFGGQRGKGKQGKRGAKQTYHNHQSNRGGHRFNESSSNRSSYQIEYENYNDYGYHYHDHYNNPDNPFRREQRGDRHRGSSNVRERGFHGRNEYYPSGFRADKGRENSFTSKKKNSNKFQQIPHQDNVTHSSLGHNSSAPSQQCEEMSSHSNTGVSNSVEYKNGRHNARGTKTSYREELPQASNQWTNMEGATGGEMSSERTDNNPVSVSFSKQRRQNSASARNTKTGSQMSGFDKYNSHNKRNERAVTSFSKHKGARATPTKLPSKENDESQRATLTEQLSANKYECMVCCDNIHVEEPIWSCKNCYHVFHLPCIKKWAQSSLSQDAKNWRCPGCQNETTYIPLRYYCFCGRRKDPKYVRGETPHSCGESCRRKRGGDCRHPCTILCHPGPCPPCSSMISVKCDCGKIRKNVRCSTTTQFKCDQVCGKKLNCMEHECMLQCHGDPCPPCTVSKSLECFCLKTKRIVMCGTEEYSMTSFSCEKPCGRTLGCGNHVCEELCHPGECAPCSLLPDNLKFCCCGKTAVKDLEIPQRQTCLDPLPTCNQVCNKVMSCGSTLQPHLCEKICHNGDCGPCSKDTTLSCECGATEKKMPCEVAVTFSVENPFKCQKRCGKKRTCGRHKCSDTCCIRDIHICEMVCGRKLSCGVHKCEELCHRGNCKRCLQASFDELTCYCGATVLEPPVPCGTRRPECHLPCTREHDCNHEVRHQCHAEEKCPPCTELTDKLCMGEHTVRKNVPCYLEVVSCGYPCNKKLPCGQHLCPKKCHKGECLEEGAVCTQPCPEPRSACGHPCGVPCHTGACPNTACKTEITISCPCGNRSTKAQCQAGGDLQANIAQFQRLSVQSMMESDGQSIDMSQFTQMKKSNKRLDCDTNCAIIERNKRLALALEIKNPDMNAKLGNPSFSDFLVDFAKKNQKFASNVEKSLSDLVHTVKQGGQANKTHTFQSMNRDQRHFVHELAEAYGCQTQSYDYEPNKNVVATAMRDKCWLPNITLVDHALKDQMPKRLSSRMGVSLTAMKKEKEEVQEKPSGSRAWETTSWRPASSSTSTSTSRTAATAVSTSAGGASAASTAAPVIDYFDFEG